MKGLGSGISEPSTAPLAFLSYHSFGVINNMEKTKEPLIHISLEISVCCVTMVTESRVRPGECITLLRCHRGIAFVTMVERAGGEGGRANWLKKYWDVSAKHGAAEPHIYPRRINLSHLNPTETERDSGITASAHLAFNQSTRLHRIHVCPR